VATRTSRGVLALVSFVAVAGGWLLGIPAPIRTANAAVTPALPPGFIDETLVTGLNLPTVMAISPGGRVFVGQKGGVVKTWPTFASFASNGAPTQTIDISTDVYNYWDRGLMGLAVDPGWPASPYIYVLYTYDAPPGRTAPVWNDVCPSPANGGPGATTDGCLAQNRIDRITVNTSTGVATARTNLLLGWCQQFPSHTAGTLAFGADGALYASAGEGASFQAADWGQFGGTEPTIANPITPADPCHDPVDPAYLPGGAQYGLGYDPNAEGGAMRAQSFRRTNAPVLLNATLLRLNKATGAAAAGNPAIASPDLNARRIVAYGFRNPFRFTIRPGTNDVWVGNVGSTTWEAIDRVPNPTAAGGPLNFGWPCHEGTSVNTYYRTQSFTVCTSLLSSEVTNPTFEYHQGVRTVPGDACGSGGASISGLSFYEGSAYPPAYRKGLFFVDYTRNCLSLLQAGSDGLPDSTKPLAFGVIPNPTQLLFDPNGDLLYVDFDQSSATAGQIHRIRYQPPVARLTASASGGPAPLHVDFDGSTSTAPAGITSYDWDFGDGTAHGTAASVSHDYAAGGFTATLTITDSNGSTATASQSVQSGTLPTVTVDSPTAATHWAVGDTISLQAHATDAYDATLANSAFSWNVSIEHCPSDCHEHNLVTRSGPSTSFDAPDHDYPSWLKVTLTVTDSIGLVKTVTIDHVDPLTTTMTVTSNPTGLPVSIDGNPGFGPVGPATVIVGHQATIAAQASYTSAETTATFTGWSDLGTLSHVVTVSSPSTYTASYSRTTHDRSNTCSSAPVETGNGAWWMGQFLTAGDVDWLRFKVAAGTYRIVLGNLPTTANLELWDGCSSLRVHADASGTHWEEIVATLPAGTYGLKVTDTGGASPGSYGVRVTSIATPVGITTSAAIDKSTQVRLVGELLNRSTGNRSVTVTAKLYSTGGTLLKTYSIHPLVNPMPGSSRETFALVVPRPTGYGRTSFSVSSVATSTVARVLPVSGLTSAAGAGGTWVVHGTATNTRSTTATAVQAMVGIFNVWGGIVDVTRVTVGTGTIAAHGTATFTATFTVSTAIQVARVGVHAT